MNIFQWACHKLFGWDYVMYNDAYFGGPYRVRIVGNGKKYIKPHRCAMIQVNKLHKQGVVIPLTPGAVDDTNRH